MVFSVLQIRGGGGGGGGVTDILGVIDIIYTFQSLFITSCSTFRLIKAFIKKVFLSMSHSLHTAYAHHFECFCSKTFKMVGISSVNKNIQNGGHPKKRGFEFNYM